MKLRDFSAYLGFLLLAILAPWASAAESRPPNVIFILVDDMGWTDLGCTGSDLYESPHIDTLARDGMRFKNAYSACTVCSPTRAAVMTGKYPARLHITDWIHGQKSPFNKLKLPQWTEYLPYEQVTVAAALKPAGYVSASVGKWHLGDGEEHYPTRHGFDVNIAGYGAGSPPSYFAPFKIPTLKDGRDGECLTDRLADEACKFIETNRERPFLLYMPHYAVHTPLQGKTELIAKYEAKLKPGLRHTNPIYASMIHSLDDCVGKLLAKLDELKIADRTAVFFTSDNGGLLRSTTNVPAREGKGSSYEGGVRVPLLVRWPGVVKPGGVCEEPVISIDYYPTLLEMAGTKGDAKHNESVDGASITRLLRDPAAKLDRRKIYWHYPHYHGGGSMCYGAMRDGDWKLIEFYEDMRVELYNLRDDFSETNDLSTAMPDKSATMRAEFHKWRESVGAQMPTPNPNYDPAKAKGPIKFKTRY